MIERIEVARGALSPHSHTLTVRHTHTCLTRGLEYGERVEVTDGTHAWLATVTGIDFELADTIYRLELPAPPVAPKRPSRVGPLSTDDVVALLHKLAYQAPHPSRATWSNRSQA